MKKSITTIIFLFLLGFLCAQNTDFDKHREEMQKKWNQHVNATHKEYADFRERLNAAYAERMKENWKTFQLRAADFNNCKLGNHKKSVTKNQKQNKQ